MINRKCLFLLFVLFAGRAVAQESQVPVPVVCYGELDDTFSVIAQKYDNSASRTVTSAIEVTYTDFPENAKAAFEKAVSIWETYIVSSQKIKINAAWKSLDATVLAQTGATKIYRNFPLAPLSNVWYPVALAEAIADRNLNMEDAEINVNVNSSVNWSYSLTAVPVSGRFDMVTVILHEIAHGLGINSSMVLTTDETKGQWGQSTYPYAFDDRVQNGNGQKLIDTGIFGNPSVELKTEFTANNLFFLLSDRIYQGKLPQLHAPDVFKSGGSISHLDERIYPPGTENSLMTPSIRSAEVNHNPGTLTLLMLNQLGWGVRNLNVDTNIITANEDTDTEVQLYPNPSSDRLRLILPTAYLNAEILIVNVSGVAVQKLTASSTDIIIPVTGWPVGSYFIVCKTDDEKYVVKKFIVAR